MYKHIIFGVVNTLITTISGRVTPDHAGDILLLPGVQEKLGRLRLGGVQLSAFDNQGGVSFGILTELQVWDIMLTANALLEGALTRIKLNFYHVDGKFRDFYKDRAKPKPNMLEEILMESETSIRDALVVGSAYNDEMAAQAAGIDFIWAKDYFRWPAEGITQDIYGHRFETRYLDKVRGRLCSSRRV